MLQNEVGLPAIGGAIRKLGNKYSNEDIVEGYEEILSLKEQGFFSIEDIEKIAASKEVNTNLKALCLHVSHNCNLRCDIVLRQRVTITVAEAEHYEK